MPTQGPAHAALTPGLRRGLVLAVLLLCLMLFFRDALLSRLTLLYGDSYDGMIEVSILNHWYNVLVHGAPWTRTEWFAPVAGTLGYNDTYVIPGLFFTLARLVGADPFIATFVSHVAMKAIGFLGMYAMLRRGLSLGTGYALAGAALFATANASLLHMYHAQLLAVGLVPWLMLLAIATVRAALEDRTGWLWRSGLGFAVLFGAAALNAFYQIWFLCMFALVFVPVGLFVAGKAQRAALWSAARRHWRALGAIAAAMAGAMVPFLLVYLPKLAESHGHDFGEVRAYLPVTSAYLNVGSGNLLWGWILPTTQGGEQRFGAPPAFLLLVLAAAVWGERCRTEQRMLRALAITLGILLLLMTRWSATATFWLVVYDWVPGASGVRVITRFLLFLLIPATAMILLMLQRWRLHPAAATALLAFLLLEQVQRAAPLMLDRRDLLNMLADTGPPPAACDSFFVVSARPIGAPLVTEAERVVDNWGGNGTTDAPMLVARYRHNVDAMMLASYYRRPTINGISTFNPPGWNLDLPDEPDYLSRIVRYARTHKVGRLCGLDRRQSPHWFALRWEEDGAGLSRTTPLP